MKANSIKKGGLTNVILLSKTANQSIANITTTKVTWQTNTTIPQLNSNPSALFDFTNNRLTPKVAGWYFVHCKLLMTLATGKNMYQNFAINGATMGEFYAGSNDGIAVTSSAAMLFYMNGTTDYLEVQVYQDSGSSQNVAFDHNSSLIMFLIG